MKTRHLSNVPRALLIIGILAALLSACAPQDQRQEINFVFMKTSELTEPYWQDVIGKFESENPNIKVNLYIFDWGVGDQEIQKMIDAGNPPTLARVATRWVPTYMAAGLLETVDKYITDEFRSQFIPVLMNEGSQYDGLTFGLPITVTSRAMYYNKDLFAKAGISEPPTTWEDLKKDAAAIRALGPDIYGFGIQGKDVDTSTYFYYFLWGNGGDVLTADGTRPAFNGEEGQAALNFIHGMMDEGLTQPDPALTDRNALMDLFRDGRLGMVITPPMLSTKLAKEAPALNYGLAPIPYNTDPITIAAQDSLILFKQSTDAQKEAAWKFINFLYQDEYRLKYALMEGVLPEKVSVAEKPEITENPSTAFFMNQLYSPSARFEQVNVRSVDIATAVAEALQATYRGEMSPADALKEAETQVLRILSYSATSW
ncbi:MAG TPA: sugar ABC transporter substrate-binding protein [Anaerolineales bacterium]|nr:sugar ABC transporter substrate-binding protein [Anaerolineales bacterium]